MKLLAKFNKANIIATVIVLIIGAFCFYFILHFILLSQLDAEMKLEEQEITDYVKENKLLPKAADYKDLHINFTPTSVQSEKAISSVKVFDVKEDEFIVQRRLNFPLFVGGKYYRAAVSKSQQETEDLIKLIGVITLGLVALLFIGLFIINRFVLNKLWHPFYNTLHELKKFDLNDDHGFVLKNNNIIEFEELNDAVIKMRSRVVNDYNALKSFTENASHEIQTPLAVIKAKLELLLQAEDLSENQMSIIQTVQDETNRMSKLNQSLLLLTKIDNGQFYETGRIFLAKIINRQLNNYEELFGAKHITVSKNISETVSSIMNETMAEVLISNLITNAVKHNIENGSVDINLNDTELRITNAGALLQTEPMLLFERFKKDNTHTESLGLGLSIVKRICDRYNFKIDYGYAEGFHIITVLFN